MANYVICIDENGQPYIAHSVFTKARDAVSSTGRSAHKYIAKIGEGAKARYFYTQEELRAYYNQGKSAVSKAATTARNAAAKAASTSLSKVRSGVSKAREVTQRAGTSVKSSAYAAIEAAKTPAKKAAAIAALAGITVAAVPAIVLSMPALAAVVVAKAAKIKISEFAGNHFGNVEKRAAESFRASGDTKTADYYDQEYQKSFLGKTERAKTTIAEILKHFKRK